MNSLALEFKGSSKVALLQESFTKSWNTFTGLKSLASYKMQPVIRKINRLCNTILPLYKVDDGFQKSQLHRIKATDSWKKDGWLRL